MSVDVIQLLSLLITLIALIFAIIQAWQARTHVSVLSEIRESLSTRFLGIFPSYLPQVNRLLEKAQHQIDICFGLPTHGVFSDHAAWLKGRNVLTEMRDRGVGISIVCSDKDHRDLMFAAQFSQILPDWGSWKARPANNKKFDMLLKDHSSMDVKDLTADAFSALIERIQHRTLLGDFRGMDLAECAATITNFFLDHRWQRGGVRDRKSG